MNIYIPVEVKVRELEGKTLLALAAAERGHTVIIGGKEDTLGLARRGMLKPGIVHDKSLTPSSAKLEALRELNDGGHVVTSQDEENGLLEVSYERFARLRYSKETCAMAGRILCWGSHDAQGVRNLCGPDAPNTIVATGSPRVDLWRREFSEYYKRTEHLTTGKLGDYVLVSSNLGVMLDFRPFWEEISHLREKYSRDGGELFDEDVEYAYYKEAGWLTCLLSEFIRMIRALAVSEPELRIVVRPHPVEIEEGWRVLIGDYPNVIVTKEGPINRWIRGAKALIHNGCTSGFEAAISGVPRIAYAPIPSEFEQVVPNTVSYRAESLEALLTAVRTVSHGDSLDIDPHKQAEEEALLRDLFANLDGPLAVDRIVDQWEQLATPSLEQANDWARLRRVVLSRRLKSGVGWALAGLRLRRRRSGRWKSVTKHKYPIISDVEMQTMVTDFKSCLGRFDGVVCERLAERSFTFRRA